MNAWPTRLISGVPPARVDRLGDGPARADVVDHLRARVFLEHRLGQQRGDEVARDELARVVDEEAAVRVAVEGRTELGAVLAHLRDHELAVLGEQRVRLVVRERPVRLEVVGDGIDGDPFQDRREHHAGHPVGRVDDDALPLDRAEVDEGQDLVHEGRKDVLLAGPVQACQTAQTCRIRTTLGRGCPGGPSPRRRAARRGGRSSSPCTPSGCATRSPGSRRRGPFRRPRRRPSRSLRARCPRPRRRPTQLLRSPRPPS